MESAVRLCLHYTVMAFPGASKTIRYSVNTYPNVTLLFRDLRAAASLRHRNRATTVLMCEQKPYRPGMIFMASSIVPEPRADNSVSACSNN